MNNRTAVLFLILCMVVLLGLLELEKMWQRDQQIKKDTQLTERSIAQEAQRKAEEYNRKKSNFRLNMMADQKPILLQLILMQDYPMILIRLIN